MSVQSCKRCHILFQYSETGPQLCPNCTKQDEADFDVVRQYLNEHPFSSGQEVNQATGISLESILRWLREGRLISLEMTGILKCENCGTPIFSGKFCTECRYKLVKDLKGIAAPKSEEQPVQMQPKQDVHGMQFMNKD
ncbi:hypothetical protein [Butyrivibrio sp. YAB3001]|uniref:hypothetical protein n=1 Tax=Butyrivibrio sp. YAB3001 TaxID=1520812 RepID=UPI0008F66683|nr:hypothetical protein [Butyrivibrio sp. YAB3001]SFD11522.1 hypothetical protein SAMN02910398_04103 [Butyrivibrio sp. YAB3001]